MTALSLSDAHRALLDMANRGREYPNNEVYLDHQTAPGTEVDTVGKGFDLDRYITVNMDGSDTDVHVQLRVLAMTNGNLFVRTWLNWTSSFGDHRSFARYDLSPTAMVILGSMPPANANIDPETLPDEDELDEQSALEALDDYLGEMDDLGAEWAQFYPNDPEDITNEEIEYHSKFVLAARETEPMLLNMLSEVEVGGAEPQEVIDLHTWLSQQPEVTALA